MGRTSPGQRAEMRNAAVSYEGLDPEMEATLHGEVSNQLKQKMMYAPRSMAQGPESQFADVKKGKSSTAPKARKKFFGIF